LLVYACSHFGRQFDSFGDVVVNGDDKIFIPLLSYKELVPVTFLFNFEVAFGGVQSLMYVVIHNFIRLYDNVVALLMIDDLTGLSNNNRANETLLLVRVYEAVSNQCAKMEVLSNARSDRFLAERLFSWCYLKKKSELQQRITFAGVGTRPNPLGYQAVT
jgi:hypothetical protein